MRNVFGFSRGCDRVRGPAGGLWIVAKALICPPLDGAACIGARVPFDRFPDPDATARLVG